MNMDLGISTLLFPDGDPEDGVRLATDLDVEHIEMILDMPHFPLNPDSERLKELSEATKSSNLQIRAHGRFWDLNPVSLYPEMRKLSYNQTIESIDACKELGGDITTIHPGRSWFRGNEELFKKCKKWFQEYLTDTSKYAEEKGIKLALETGSHSADYPGNPKELLQSVKNHENIGITIDIGHLYLSAQNRDVNAEKWIGKVIEMLETELINVHVHDNNGHNDDHLPPGRGEIDFEPIVKALTENYDGPLILEIWDLTDPLEVVKKSIRYLRSLE